MQSSVRTGAPWRALPEEYEAWNAVYSRFRRWQMKGFWKAVFLALASDPDLEAVMIDGTYIHAHKHSAGAKEGSTDKLWAAVASKLHAQVDALGNPVSFFFTGGEGAGISVAPQLLEGVRDCTVIADKGYDSEPLVQLLEARGCIVAIPPSLDRKTL